MLIELFFTFFKIGSFTFGGGYAMIPLIEREIIVNKGWIDEEELLEITSISQMTPGVIAINAATFVGKKTAGIKGALIASFAVILPSIFIISIIVNFLSEYFTSNGAQKVLTGIRAGVVALILKSVIRLLKSLPNKTVGLILFLTTLSLLIFTKIGPIPLIIVGAFLGIISYKILPNTTLKLMKRSR